MVHVVSRVREGIVVCCDRRLRPSLDSLYNNGRRVTVSVAGADVRAARGTIRRLAADGVRRWAVLTHSDSRDLALGCGWAGRLALELQAGGDRAKLPARYVGRETAEDFESRGLLTREAIEAHNLEVQESALEEALAGTGARPERGAVLDTAKMFTDDLLGHVLVVAPPSEAKYSSFIPRLNGHGGSSVGPYNTYYVQVLELDEVASETKLVTGALGVKDVRLLPQSRHDEPLTANWAKTLGGQPFMRGVGLTQLSSANAAISRPPGRRRL